MSWLPDGAGVLLFVDRGERHDEGTQPDYRQSVVRDGTVAGRPQVMRAQGTVRKHSSDVNIRRQICVSFFFLLPDLFSRLHILISLRCLHWGCETECAPPYAFSSHCILHPS